MIAVICLDASAKRGHRRDVRGDVILRLLASQGVEVDCRLLIEPRAHLLRTSLEALWSTARLLLIVGDIEEHIAPLTELDVSELFPDDDAPLEVHKSERFTAIRRDEGLALLIPGDAPALEIALDAAAPHLETMKGDKRAVEHRLGVFETEAGIVRDTLTRLRNVEDDAELTVTPVNGELEITIRARQKRRREARELTQRLGAEICSSLGYDVHGPLGQSLPRAVVEALTALNWSLSIAELGTGGVIAPRLAEATAAAGLPDSPLTIALAADRVADLRAALGLSSDLDSEAKGPRKNNSSTEGVTVPFQARSEEEAWPSHVTDEGRSKNWHRGGRMPSYSCAGPKGGDVALALAEGTRRFNQTTIGLALVGIIGPHGGDPAKPVGLLHFAVAGGTESPLAVEHRVTSMPRQGIRDIATARALRLVLDRCRERGR